MHSQHQNEIWLLIVITTLSGVLGGMLFDQALLSMVIALLVYIAFTLRNLFKLHFWLLNRKKQESPDARGFWGEIFNEIYLMDKQNKKNRTRLRSMLTRFQDAANALPDGMHRKRGSPQCRVSRRQPGADRRRNCCRPVYGL